MGLEQATLQIQFYHESRKATTLRLREHLQKMKQITAINFMPADDDRTITGTLPHCPNDDLHIRKIDSPLWTVTLRPALTVMVPVSLTSTVAVINTLNLVLVAPPLDRSFHSYLDGTQAELIRHNHGKCKQRCFDCFSQGAIRTCMSPLSHPLLPDVFV